MSASRRASMLAHAARRYYIDGLTQGQVADELHTTRSNVSRMLSAARDQGIVRFEIVEPLARQERLEQALHGAFPDVSTFIVLAADASLEFEHDPYAPVGRLAARWLEEHVRDGQQLVLSWGRSLLATVSAVDADRAYDVHVAQIGGDLPVRADLSGHDLVRTLAAALGGTYDYLHAPALCSSAAVAEELRSTPSIATELARAERADVALVGIGGFGFGFSAELLDSAHLDTDERAQLLALQPVGDIGARFFDVHGNALHGPLRDRVLGLDLDALRRIPNVVGVLSGREKAAGLLGALRGGLLDVVICDQDVAAAVIHLLRASGEKGLAA